MHPVLSRRTFERDLQGTTPELCSERQWDLFRIEFPVVDVGFRCQNAARLRVRFTCEDWNDIPPSVELLDYEGNFLARLDPDPTSVFNNGPHAMTGRPFICMRGSREYHMHESHKTDPWDDLRGQPKYRLGEILTQIWRAWRRSHP